MMSIKALFFFEFLLATLSVSAQHSSKFNQPGEGHPRPIYFSISVESSPPMRDSLEVYFWRDYVNGMGKDDGSTYFKVPVLKGNNYSFELPDIDHIGRLLLLNSQLSNLMGREIVEPGDSIRMLLRFKSRDDFQVTFKGVGAEKYNFTQAAGLKNVWEEFEGKKNPANMTMLADSLLKEKLSLLDRYKGISNPAREILKLDIIGEIRKPLIARLRYDFRNADEKSKLEFVEALNAVSDPSQADVTAVALSKHFIEYLYEKEKLKLIFLHRDNEFENGKSFSFKDLYSVLRSGYQGVGRERLLVHCILHPWDMLLFFKGADPDDYTDCLKDAIKLIKTPYLKAAVQKELLTRGKGAIAFDFSLPDSTGRIYNLHDFKGKVVLVDIWSNPCGGCKKFKEYFEKEVYPLIKDNPEIKVISIALNQKKEEWLAGLDEYSHPDFVNLYTGGAGDKHPLLSYYNIMGIPYLLLIDREGRIFSSTIPFVGRGNDLLTLITKCLKEI